MMHRTITLPIGNWKVLLGVNLITSITFEFFFLLAETMEVQNGITSKSVRHTASLEHVFTGGGKKHCQIHPFELTGYSSFK